MKHIVKFVKRNSLVILLLLLLLFLITRDNIEPYEDIHSEFDELMSNFNIIFPGFDLLVGSYRSKMYDNLDYCKENPDNDRVCKNKLLIKRTITNNDILPKQI